MGLLRTELFWEEVKKKQIIKEPFSYTEVIYLTHACHNDEY